MSLDELSNGDRHTLSSIQALVETATVKLKDDSMSEYEKNQYAKWVIETIEFMITGGES